LLAPPPPLQSKRRSKQPPKLELVKSSDLEALAEQSSPLIKAVQPGALEAPQLASVRISTGGPLHGSSRARPSHSSHPVRPSSAGAGMA
jgi:hypothetical protein